MPAEGLGTSDRKFSRMPVQTSAVSQCLRRGLVPPTPADSRSSVTWRTRSQCLRRGLVPPTHTSSRWTGVYASQCLRRGLVPPTRDLPEDLSLALQRLNACGGAWYLRRDDGPVVGELRAESQCLRRGL